MLCYTGLMFAMTLACYYLGELHLTPLNAIVQMRPSFTYLDTVDTRVKTEQAAGDAGLSCYPSVYPGLWLSQCVPRLMVIPVCTPAYGYSSVYPGLWLSQFVPRLMVIPVCTPAYGYPSLYPGL